MRIIISDFSVRSRRVRKLSWLSEGLSTTKTHLPSWCEVVKEHWPGLVSHAYMLFAFYQQIVVRICVSQCLT